MIRTLLRPLLAVLCGIALIYDLILYAFSKLKPVSGAEIRERRAHRRGLLDVQSGTDILKGLHDAAEQTGAKVFLVSGTLLGMHRQGRLLEHDYDIDVGIFADDPALPAFIAAMEAYPGRQKTAITRIDTVEAILNPWLGVAPGTPLIYKFYFQNNRDKLKEYFGIDVFIHFRANDHIVHGSYRSLWLNSPHGLVQKSYNGTDFLVPDNAVKYLHENYGDFETENKQFENSTDCPYAANIYGIRSVLWLTGRFTYFMSSHQPQKHRIIKNRLWDTVRYGLFLQSTPRWRLNQYDPGHELDSARKPR